MAEPKTRPTEASVDDFIAAQADAQRRADCQMLRQLMSAAAGAPAVMWGSAIVGFGSYEVPASGGKTISWPRIGFSPRKNDLTLYLMPGFDTQAELLARLGRHKTGKSCLYLKRLADVDMATLEQLIAHSLQALTRLKGPQS